MEQIVVAAVVLEGGRLLAAQRAGPPAVAGGWEFPGGKVEPGESDQQALVRECREELGVTITVGDQVGGDWPLSPGYVLRARLARLASGVPRPREHLALRWLGRDELFDIPWLPADLPIVRAVRDLIAED